MDRLRDLPDALNEKILQCLPLVDAVRTSVLSKKWQYMWTMLPALVFDRSFLESLSLSSQGTYTGSRQHHEYLHAIYSILLQHVGTLEEFYVLVPRFTALRRGCTNLLIHTVLKRGLEKLTIHNSSRNILLLPLSFPPCPRLTHLELKNCAFQRQSSVSGSHCLRSLILANVSCDPDTLSTMISGFPILQRIVLQDLASDGHLVICAPKVEYLYVSANAGLLSKLPRGLGELRILRLCEVEFCNIPKLRFILSLITSSPNLGKLEIYVSQPTKRAKTELLNLQDLRYDPPCFQYLENIYLCDIVGSRNELEVIRFLVSCSPALCVLSMMHASNPGKLVKKRLNKAVMKLRKEAPNAKISIRYQYSPHNKALAIRYQNMPLFR